jgi:hypothetical protein
MKDPGKRSISCSLGFGVPSIEHTSVCETGYLAPALTRICRLPEAIAAAGTEKKDAVQVRVDDETLQDVR